MAQLCDFFFFTQYKNKYCNSVQGVWEKVILTETGPLELRLVQAWASYVGFCCQKTHLRSVMRCGMW